jgi:phosphatidylinositol dimannoside acyltransferase
MVHVPPYVARPTRRPPLKVRALIAALEATSAVTGALPRATADPICRVAGALWYLSAPGARDAVRDNLRHVLGRAPATAEVVRVFHHGALNYWDTFSMSHLPTKRMLELVDLRGSEHIDRARERGRGAICITAHLGSVAFVGQILPAMGYPLVGLIEPMNPPELFAFFARQRQAMGSRLMPAGTAALRELVLALRRNEVLGLVSDRDFTGTGPLVPFFGEPTRFPDGAAALSVRTGAPLLTAIAVRKGGARFDGWIEPLPPPEPTGNPKEDVLRITQAWAGRLEYYVANHPEQWTVFQRRWPLPQSG